MTPNELLRDATEKFSVMYLTPALQDVLLRQAIATYQRIVGPRAQMTLVDNNPVPLPGGFLNVALCCDSQGRWHDTLVTGGTVAVLTTAKSLAPFTLHYFVNLSAIDPAADHLPSGSLTLLSEYLQVLLAIPNTARAREVMTATGIQAELPGDEELASRKAVLEQEMEETCAMIPMVTVY